MSIDQKFRIEHQYQNYLALVKLNEDDMHPIHKKETKQAFYGAFGISLVLFKDSLELDEKEHIEVFYNMLKQVQDHLETLV